MPMNWKPGNWEDFFNAGWYWSITDVENWAKDKNVEFGWGSNQYEDLAVVGNFFKAHAGKAKILNPSVYRRQFGELWVWCRHPATDNVGACGGGQVVYKLRKAYPVAVAFDVYNEG